MRWLAITRLTLQELRSSRLIVLPLTIVVALALVAANVENPNAYGTGFVEGLWTSLGVFGVLVAILAASGSVSNEIERGTMLLLATRPISRLAIFAGKAIGVSTYLLLCVLAWAVTLSIGLGDQLDIGRWATFHGAMYALAPALLAAAMSLACSVWFPTRGAIGTTAAVFLAAAIVAAIPLDAVRPRNVERVQLAQDVLGWVVPIGRLDDLQAYAIDQSPQAGATAALLVVGAWFVVGAVLLSARRSLAR